MCQNGTWAHIKVTGVRCGPPLSKQSNSATSTKTRSAAFVARERAHDKRPPLPTPHRTPTNSQARNPQTHGPQRQLRRRARIQPMPQGMGKEKKNKSPEGAKESRPAKP